MSGSGPSGPSRPTAPPFVTRLLPGSRATLRALQGGADWLLSVRQVAERLRVSRATVYGLIERGELAHIRVSNAIRVAPADLDAYLVAGRRMPTP